MMKDKTRYLKGKCGRCRRNHLCRGCGARAEVMCGDPFEEDPACYLTEEEITGARFGYMMDSGDTIHNSCAVKRGITTI